VKPLAESRLAIVFPPRLRSAIAGEYDPDVTVSKGH
jgi:hypothetical protein